LERIDKNVIFSIDILSLELSDIDRTCLFSRFFQPGLRPTRGESNLGIGLFLSKVISEKLGGKINIEDLEPKGTRILVIFSETQTA